MSKKTVYDLMIVLFIVISLLFSVFRFAPVFMRLIQAFCDFGTSLAYYFTELLGYYDVVSPSIVKLPNGIENLLPMPLDEFLEKWELFSELLFDWDNFVEYLEEALIWFSNALLIISTLIPSLLLIGLLVLRIYKTPKDEEDEVSEETTLSPMERARKREQKKKAFLEKTKQREGFEKFEDNVCDPIKAFVKGFFERLKERKVILVLIILLWCYNLNLFTLAIEFVAYYYYFALELFNEEGLFAYFIKLVCDLGVVVGFLPWWVWLILGYMLFNFIRHKIGDKLLKAGEDRNRDFLNEYACALFITGKQRAKKTTILTDMKLSLERLFREKAKEKFAERDMQFPYFNWLALELVVKHGQNGKLNTLYRCRRFIRELKYFFNNRGKYSEKEKGQILRRLKKRWGYDYKDFIFEYDHKRYGLEYDNGIYKVDIFEALEKYAQLYKIYQQQTPLDVSNYSIREDIKWEDKGNFPKFDGDFFDRTPEDVRKYSKRSHVIPYNAFRLGRLTDENDEFKDAVEYGIGVAAEFAKERGNKDTNVGIKKESEEANQRNDLFEVDVKMRGHAATIDNFTFFRWLFDDQRAGSLGANNKDLTDICYVKEVDDARIVMPGFMFGEWIYALARKIYDKIYYTLRFYRGDANGTLLVYLLKKLYTPIYNHYWRVFNRYSVYVAHLRVTDGMDGEVLDSSRKYYLATAKVYANRFATDSYNEFYSKKAARSNKGLNNIPMYKDVRPTYEELCAQNSYFIADISEAFGIENKKIEPSTKEEEKPKKKKA